MEDARILSRARAAAALTATCFLLFGAFPSSAATFHVDKANPQCSDSGPGTSSAPLCTIGQGATRAVAGDTVLVHSGTYSEYVTVAHSGTASAPIVIRAADGANVTVSGQSRSFEVSSKSWIRIERFTVSNTSSYGIYVNSSSNITVSANRVTLAGKPASGSTRPGIRVSGSTDCTISGNTTDHNSDAGINVTGGSTRITVVGNISSFNARGYTRAAPGIDVRSGGNTLQGNICHDNEDSGIQIYSNSGTPSPNNLIVNNLCYNNGDHGIDISSAGSQRVIGNSVYKNVTAGINVEGPSSGTTLANNIAVTNGLPTSFGTKGNLRVDGSSTSGTTIDYDLVYQYQSAVMIVWGSNSYNSLAAFRSATGQEQHGIEADPKWVAPAQGNFHLSTGSPAIDSANSGASGAMSTDLEGSPRVDDPATPNTGAGPRAYDDRGAYEYTLAGVCGNGIKEAGEQCDGSNLGGASCTTLGYFCGTGSGLSCNANCTYNTSNCIQSCPASDACHVAGTCDPSTGQCTNPAAPNGTVCNDSNACTQSDTCQAGVCTGSNPVVCSASDACHVAGTCDPSTGQCTNPAAPNGTVCNDANACTQSDTCQAGVCTGSNPVVCSASDACHVAGTCNPSTGQCTNPAAPNGTICSDGNVCTTGDACSGGVCAGGPPTNCDDANPCTVDSCDSGGGCTHSPATCNDGNVCTDDSCNPATGCVHTPNTASCNDGNLCTTGDACSGGTCGGGPPSSCDDLNPCTTDSCDPLSGCTHSPVTCNDGNVCTDDSCNPAIGCVHTPNTALCSDGNACTTGDACSGGTCGGGPPPSCDDGNVCTDDSCNPATGCVHTPNTAPCNDGSVCTTGDICSGGACAGGPPTNCDDANACTTDSCDPVAGCTHSPLACNDGNTCTDDSCDPATGCVHTPNTAPCDDESACTTGDACTGGACTGNPVPNCGQAVEVRVSVGSDDAEEATSGSVLLTSSDLDMMNDGSTVQAAVGLRFTGVGIANGASISNAYVQFKVDEISTETTALTIQGQAADDAATFTTAAGNVSSRPRTSAAVTWTPLIWPTVEEVGPNQRTPNLAGIIQQIVNRSGWMSGHSLAIIITGSGRRVAKSLEGDAPGAPLLHIELGPPPPNQPPNVSAGADQTVVLPNSANLDGTVLDDGLPNPPGMTTSTWSKASGPGTVTFADEHAVDTTASFSASGTYVLRLTVDDGALTSSDEATVTVLDVGSTVTLEVRVAMGSDDAEEKPTGSSVSLTSSDLELVTDGTFVQTVGMRFNNVTIPQGATIDRAYIQFKVDEVSSEVTSLTIQGQASDNAATFTTAVGNVSSRPRTAAAVSWSPLAWNTVGLAGPDQQTPDLRQVIQEIVDRLGWVSGRSLAIIVTGSGRRVAKAFEGEAAGAPLLHVEYR